MAVCDKWVAVKVCEFLTCVACLVAKRVSDDDSERLSLLMQKLSREWSLLRSVTWDSMGGSFADALYGGYVLITFGLLLGRIFQEVPRGRRILEGFLLGVGMLLFLTIGGLELASLDSIPNNLIVNAAVLGTLSLVVAALFLIDLMGPRVITTTHHSQTDIPVVSTAPAPNRAALTLPLSNGKANGHLPNEQKKDSKDTIDGDIQKKDKDEHVLFERPKHGYTKFADDWEKDLKDDLGKSKFGSYRNSDTGRFDAGNYVRLSDPLAEPDKMHYERELAKFNEKYFREYLDSKDSPPAIPIKEEYFPELQTPILSKVKSGRIRSLYDELSPSYRQKSPPKHAKNSTPTLQQLEDYLRGSQHHKNRARADTPTGITALFPMDPIEEAHDSIEGRASGTPTDPGYVQYAADRWSDSRKTKTPRHSPTE